MSFCVSVWALAAPSYGQLRLTLAEAVSEATANNALIRAAAARVAVAEGQRHQAGLGPNPRLILQSENTRFTGDPPFSYSRDADSYAFLAQTIETGGKRRRRVDMATENVRRNEWETQLQRQQLIKRVSTAYWTAAGAIRSRDLLNQEVAGFERVVQFHRDRVREGAAPELDLLRIELERDRLATLARTAAQDSERARIALLREMGKTEFPPVELTDALETLPSIQTLSIEEILERRADLKVSRAEIDMARANLRLQQAIAKPDPDAQFGYKRTAGYDTLYAAVQIPLPVRNRNQGQIETATADIKVAESSLAAVSASIRSELEAARADYELRRKSLAETLQPMRTRASDVYKIADAAYREGGTDILRLLDAERLKIETDLAYTRAMAELQLSLVALQAAQGNLQ